MITIDHEMNTKLKEEPNASKIINDLLNAHYGQGKLSKEMIESGIVELEQLRLLNDDKMKRLKEQLKEANKPKSMLERTTFG